MHIVLLLKMMRGRDRWWAADFSEKVGGMTGVEYHPIIFFLVILRLFSHVLSPFI